MKVGDEYKVQMEGFHVANAVIEQIEGDEAVVYIPATRIVLGVSQSLVEKEPEAQNTLLGGGGEIDNGILPQSAPATAPAAPQTAPVAPVSPEQSERERLAQAEIAAAYAGTQSLREMNLDSNAIDKD